MHHHNQFVAVVKVVYQLASGAERLVRALWTRVTIPTDDLGEFAPQRTSMVPAVVEFPTQFFRANLLDW